VGTIFSNYRRFGRYRRVARRVRFVSYSFSYPSTLGPTAISLCRDALSRVSGRERRKRTCKGRKHTVVPTGTRSTRCRIVVGKTLAGKLVASVLPSELYSVSTRRCWPETSAGRQIPRKTVVRYRDASAADRLFVTRIRPSVRPWRAP